MTAFVKDPAEVLDYAVDWSAWLTGDDTIADIAWTVPDGLTEPAEHPATVVDGKATVWLSGGTAGQTYAITCRATTAQGRIGERTIRVLVRDL